MRVLHVVKTSDGADFAARQARSLVRLGVEVHVALPSLRGRVVDDWERAGAVLHEAALDFPVSAPWTLPRIQRRARELVASVAPDLIHSHFVGTTLVLRSALRARSRVPIVYQVAGPLHLEHAFYRRWEISSAGERDVWIGSSQYVNRLYRAAAIAPSRLFLSYYGNDCAAYRSQRSGLLRKLLGIGPEKLMVGNINYIYPPKLHLGQTVGLKGHETVIDALARLLPEKSDLVGVLVGGQWGGGHRYEAKLRRRCAARGFGRLQMPGPLSAAEAGHAWADFDLAVHVPLSENCGGVLEPLLCGVPVVASATGGIPELVQDGVTGRLLRKRTAAELASVVREVLADLPRHQRMAQLGRKLVSVMFDVERTAVEVKQIYRHLLDPAEQRPPEFDAARTAAELGLGSQLAP